MNKSAKCKQKALSRQGRGKGARGATLFRSENTSRCLWCALTGAPAKPYLQPRGVSYARLVQRFRLASHVRRATLRASFSQGRSSLSAGPRLLLLLIVIAATTSQCLLLLLHWPDDSLFFCYSLSHKASSVKHQPGDEGLWPFSSAEPCGVAKDDGVSRSVAMSKVVSASAASPELIAWNLSQASRICCQSVGIVAGVQVITC